MYTTQSNHQATDEEELQQHPSPGEIGTNATMTNHNDSSALDELESMFDGNIQPSEFVGDPLDDNIDNTRTRMYIQNLNGLMWNKEGGRWPYICETMDAIQADISCFCELNVDTNNYAVRKQMESICQRQFTYLISLQIQINNSIQTGRHCHHDSKPHDSKPEKSFPG
jgi:hypothetical protein